MFWELIYLIEVSRIIGQKEAKREVNDDTVIDPYNSSAWFVKAVSYHHEGHKAILA